MRTNRTAKNVIPKPIEYPINIMNTANVFPKNTKV